MVLFFRLNNKIIILMKSLTEFLNEGQKENDVKSILQSMLPILNKISQKDRIKMDSYTDNPKFESPLVDIFYDEGVTDNDDYYDEIQELVNDFLESNKILGAEAIDNVKKIKL